MVALTFCYEDKAEETFDIEIDDDFDVDEMREQLDEFMKPDGYRKLLKKLFLGISLLR